MPRFACVGALILAVAVASLRATVVVPMEFREIVNGAGLIVRGTVTDVRGLMTRDRGVDSIATVAVDEVLKGAASGFVAVRVPGGTVGRYRVVMVGAPVLRVNQQAVFFLARGQDNTWHPMGLSAGIARVERDATSQRAVVRVPAARGLAASSDPVARTSARGNGTALGVDEFESLVRLVMADPSRRRAIPRE